MPLNIPSMATCLGAARNFPKWEESDLSREGTKFFPHKFLILKKVATQKISHTNFNQEGYPSWTPGLRLWISIFDFFKFLIFSKLSFIQ